MRYHSLGTACLTACLALERSLRQGAGRAEGTCSPRDIEGIGIPPSEDETEIFSYHLYPPSLAAPRSEVVGCEAQ